MGWNPFNSVWIGSGSFIVALASRTRRRISPKIISAVCLFLGIAVENDCRHGLHDITKQNESSSFTVGRSGRGVISSRPALSVVLRSSVWAGPLAPISPLPRRIFITRLPLNKTAFLLPPFLPSITSRELYPNDGGSRLFATRSLEGRHKSADRPRRRHSLGIRAEGEF